MSNPTRKQDTFRERIEHVQGLSDSDGHMFSPIELDITTMLPLDLPQLEWYNYDLMPQKMKITNTTHTVILSAKWLNERPFLNNGPMLGNYIFSQLHFHWGASEQEGSEHHVDGQSFPLEMHVVHFKNCYSTQDRALREKDGLVVIAYFFKISPEPNPDIQCIISALPQIIVPHTSCQLPPQPISSFLRMFDRDYFLYWGSVMTSSCAHRILWFVSREPIPISLEQMATFRLLKSSNDKPMTDNFRRPKPIGNRSVFHVSGTSCGPPTLLPLISGVRRNISKSRSSILKHYKPKKALSGFSSRSSRVSSTVSNNGPSSVLLQPMKESLPLHLKNSTPMHISFARPMFTTDSLPIPTKESMQMSTSESLPMPTKESMQMSTSELLPMPTKESMQMSTSESLSMPTKESMQIPISKSLSMPIKESMQMPISKSISMPTKKSTQMPTSKSLLMPTKESMEMPTSEMSMPTKASLQMPTSESLAMPTKGSMQIPTSKSLSMSTKESIQMPASVSMQLSTSESIQMPISESLSMPTKESMQLPKAESLPMLKTDPLPMSGRSSVFASSTKSQSMLLEESTLISTTIQAPISENKSYEKNIASEIKHLKAGQMKPSAMSLYSDFERAMHEIIVSRVSLRQPSSNFFPENKSREPLKAPPPSPISSEMQIQDSLYQNMKQQIAFTLSVDSTAPRHLPTITSDEHPCSASSQFSDTSLEILEAICEKTTQYPSINSKLSRCAIGERQWDIGTQIPSVPYQPLFKVSGGDMTLRNTTQAGAVKSQEFPDEKFYREFSYEARENDMAWTNETPSERNLEIRVEGVAIPVEEATIKQEIVSGEDIPLSKEDLETFEKEMTSHLLLEGETDEYVQIEAVDGEQKVAGRWSLAPNFIPCLDKGSVHITPKVSALATTTVMAGFIDVEPEIFHGHAHKMLNWPDEHLYYDGGMFSPVDIESEKVRVREFRDMEYHYHFDSSPNSATLTNTGHTVQVALDNPNTPWFIRGGPLNSDYEFEQMHFHWGEDDSAGSEHRVNGAQFSMEAHAVHKKTGLKTMKEAKECLEGIAVVAIFFQVKCKQKCAEIDCKSDKLERLVDYLPQVRRPYSKTEVPSNVLEWFMDRAKPSGYYTYPGSFSLDTSSEVVTWLVYPRPITICQSQVEPFRQLEEGGHLIKRNYASVKPFNNRPMFLSKR